MPRKKAVPPPSPASPAPFELSPAEMQAVLKAREQVSVAPPAPQQEPAASQSSVDVLAAALIKAINITKPKEKVNAAYRIPKTAWSPKAGEAKVKLKRKSYQHGIPIDPDMISNEEIALLNQLKPGLYCDGWVKVIRRRDRGINIEYPVKTASQRLRLTSQFGVRNLKELLELLIYQAANPKSREEVDADGDLI